MEHFQRTGAKFHCNFPFFFPQTFRNLFERNYYVAEDCVVMSGRWEQPHKLLQLTNVSFQSFQAAPRIAQNMIAHSQAEQSWIAEQ